MTAITAAAARTFLISAIGLEGGETLHYNGAEFPVITSDSSSQGPHMRVYYATPFGRMDFLVLKKDEMVTIS